jgi:hypothetical protein
MSADQRGTGLDVADLHGWGLLACDAVIGLAGVVESMHHGIARAPGILGPPVEGRTRGITGLVYGTIRGAARLAGAGLDAALAPLARRRRERLPSATREAVLAALNGVVGDHLAATGNPLAIGMRFRSGGRALPLEPAALAAALPEAGPQPVVLVHGACMNDLRWLRQGHDHGAALARDLGRTPVYLHYNTGLHISTNGRAFADALEALVRAWPVPVERLAIVAHSMGGLVARSACLQGEALGHAWRRRVRHLVFLGTPHHGAPLARGGNWVDAALGLSPYSAPIARLGRIRSAGITDLRHGSLVDQDWVGRDRFAPAGPLPRAVPLPARVACCAVAATAAKGRLGARVVGDGLVPVDSALGRHPDPGRALAFPESRRWVATGINHFDLLGDRGVYRHLRAWLSD